MKKTTLLACALVLGLAPAFAQAQSEPAPPPAKAGDEEEIRKRLEELEQKLLVLEKQKEAEQEAIKGKAKGGAVCTAGKDGFIMKSADGSFQLKLRALMNLDARFWKDDVAKRAVDTFEMRRARPIIEGTVGKYFDFRIAQDFGEGKTTLFDAYADWRFAPWIRLRAGKFKSPVGLERLQSASDTAFAERALPTNLVPNRDVGLAIQGDVFEGVLTYALGLFNGVPDGANVDLDTNDSKEAAARVFFQPFRQSSAPSLQNFGIGVGGSQGRSLGSVTATSLPSYKTPGQQTFFLYRTDTPATLAGTTIAHGRRSRLSPQIYWYVRRIGLMAEYVESRQGVALGTSREELKNSAWEATAAFALSDDRPTYRGIAPKRPFDPAAHGWGAFEIVARAAALKVDRKAFPIFANPASSASEAQERGLGFNWYLNQNVKWMLDYIETRFTDGAATGDREDERVLFNRLQIAF